MTDIYGVPWEYRPLERTDNRPNAEFASKNGKARYITVHETANFDDGADAEATAAWVHGGSQNADGVQLLSFHDVVDHLQGIQLLRSNERGYHAGDGAGPGNQESWGLEICVNLDGEDRETAVDNGARRVAWLLDAGHGWDGVYQHNQWSGKDCPHDIRDGYPMDWAAFLDLVESYRGGPQPEKGDEDMADPQAREMAREAQVQVDRINEVFVEQRFPKMQEAAAKLREAADLLAEASAIDVPQEGDK